MATYQLGGFCEAVDRLWPLGPLEPTKIPRKKERQVERLLAHIH